MIPAGADVTVPVPLPALVTLSVKLASESGKLQVMFGECELEVGEPPPKAEE